MLIPKAVKGPMTAEELAEVRASHKARRLDKTDLATIEGSALSGTVHQYDTLRLVWTARDLMKGGRQVKTRSGELLAVQNKIILIQDEPEKKVGSIVLADVGQKKRYSGRVVAVGPGKPLPLIANGIAGIEYPPQVQVGDVVHFMDYHGGEVEVGGVKYLVIDEDDVLAVVRGGS